MDQVQCPNCGGYKVSTEVKILNRNTGAELAAPGCLLWGYIAFFGFSLLFGIYLLAESESGSSIRSQAGSMIFGSFIMLLPAIWALVKYSRTEKIERYDNHCLLCGYRWSRRTDEPLPKVNVQPDLIAAGEQRLQEMAKRRQDAADLWHMTHQRGKGK